MSKITFPCISYKPGIEYLKLKRPTLFIISLLAMWSAKNCRCFCMNCCPIAFFLLFCTYIFALPSLGNSPLFQLNFILLFWSDVFAGNIFWQDWERKLWISKLLLPSFENLIIMSSSSTDECINQDTLRKGFLWSSTFALIPD